jgi:hypothetical protein
MAMCGLCRETLARRVDVRAFPWAIGARKRIENLRYIAGVLQKHPVLSDHGQQVLARLVARADDGEPHLASLHDAAHGQVVPPPDWAAIRRWFDVTDDLLEPWMRKALAAGN